MPKITSQNVKRIHLTIFESDYNKLQNLANQNNTSISEILRTCINLVIQTDKQETNIVEINNKQEKQQSPTILHLDF